MMKKKAQKILVLALCQQLVSVKKQLKAKQLKLRNYY